MRASRITSPDAKRAGSRRPCLVSTSERGSSALLLLDPLDLDHAAFQRSRDGHRDADMLHGLILIVETDQLLVAIDVQHQLGAILRALQRAGLAIGVRVLRAAGFVGD